MELKNLYIEKLESQIKELKAKIDVLEAKAEAAKAEGKIEAYKQLQNINSKYYTLKAKVNDLKSSSSDVWEDLKDGVEVAWSDLKKATAEAISNYSHTPLK